MALPVAASTIMTAGALVAWSSGALILATSTTAPSTIAGVVQKTITAADADYAVANRLIPVEVPVESGVIWEFATASLVAADQGLYCDLTDSLTVNRGASTYDVVQVIKLVSATVGQGFLNIGTFGCGVIGA